MVKKAKVDYDYENDVLYVYTGEKVKDSLDIENFVIDFSSDNKIVAVEVLDASKVLNKMLQINISKDALSDVKEAGINIYQGREIIYVVLMFPIIVNKRKFDVRVPVPTAVATVPV
ncbi:MAG: DUF2283 domain-containing protein [Candidatus Aenigmarchaeota archaeon]|nr:DUF2283 domain-containing protein [Candidatus Aenigmarchaeota archaeon]